MSGAHPSLTRPREWWWATVGVAVLVSVGAVAAALSVVDTSGSAGGIQNGSVFLTHWQQVGVFFAATPNPVPTLASALAGTPTRLPGGSGSFTLNAARAGHQALEWRFTEALGMPLNEEVEIALTLQYTAAAVVHNVTLTVYFESQAAAPVVPLTFNLFWDAGAAAGITFGAESEISQTCSAVGACP